MSIPSENMEHSNTSGVLSRSPLSFPMDQKLLHSVLKEYIPSSKPEFVFIRKQLAKLWTGASSKVNVSRLLQTLESARNLYPDIVSNLLVDRWISPESFYPSSHSVNVCLFSYAMGKHLGFDENESNNIAIAGLLKDLGEIHLRSDTLMQASPLDEHTSRIIRKHPRRAVTFLRETGFKNEQVLDLIYRHHERYDGSGYPEKLAGDEISKAVYTLGLSDVYCALICARPYRDAITPKQAAREILLMKGRQFPDCQVSAFVRELGYYPPGSVVQLNDGQTAVTLDRPRDNSWMSLILDPVPNGMKPFKVDLNSLPKAYIVKELF